MTDYKSRHPRERELVSDGGGAVCPAVPIESKVEQVERGAFSEVIYNLFLFQYFCCCNFRACSAQTWGTGVVRLRVKVETGLPIIACGGPVQQEAWPATLP